MLIRPRAPRRGETDPPQPTFRVLVVSRDSNIVGMLRRWVNSRTGCRAVLVDNISVAERSYRTERPALVVLDGACEEGLAALERLRTIDPAIPIVALLPDHSIPRVVEAVRLGASDVMTPPFDATRLDATLDAALAAHQMEFQMATLREDHSQSRRTMLFGNGDAMAALRDMIDRIRDTDVPVLIQGETGTGKELVARALAACSLQRGEPFVTINCAALPNDLLEAELFGFERGAFTGAICGKPGKFELANGGAIFLDEVAEIPVHLQSKLLQVLQDGHFWRLGGHDEIRASVRVIAATNRDLDHAVANGQFREDLLFRLNVIPLRLPPLRERRGDIPLLTEFFLNRWSAVFNRLYSAISPDMMDELLEYAWPGNIRELENLIQRTVVLGSEASARETLARTLPFGASAAPDGPDLTTVAAMSDVDLDLDPCSLKQVSRFAARQAERAVIMRMLQQTRGNRKAAAANLGISYKALLYKAREHSIGTGPFAGSHTANLAPSGRNARPRLDQAASGSA